MTARIAASTVGLMEYDDDHLQHMRYIKKTISPHSYRGIQSVHLRASRPNCSSKFTIRSRHTRCIAMATEDIEFTPCGISRKTTTDFIDHHMPAQHPAFYQPPLNFDPASGKYMLNKQALALSSDNASPASSSQMALPTPTSSDVSVASVPGGSQILGSQGNQLLSREAITDLQSMKFWSKILPAARTQLCEGHEPKGLSNTDFSIRSKKEWKDIYETLEAAKKKYEDVKGPLGQMSRLRRKVADRSSPVSGFIKAVEGLLPDSDYTAPVVGTVKLIVDASLLTPMIIVASSLIAYFISHRLLVHLLKFARRLFTLLMIFWTSSRQSNSS